MSNKFYLQENFRERFYQLPKVFFTNETYKKLSNDAKIAYAILRDRLELSITNGWVDEENAIYFIYTNENLMSILNLGKNKIVKIKKELENVNLLEQKRQGLNKPNKLYLMKPDVNINDIYKIQESESNVNSSNDTEVYKTNFQKSSKQTSRSPQNKLLEVYKTNSNDTDYSDTDYSDTEINDMNDMNDSRTEFKALISEAKQKLEHSYHSNHLEQNTNVDIESLKNYELQEFPHRLKHYINNFSLKEIKVIKQVIFKAKAHFNNTHSTCYMLEDLDEELLPVIKRFKAILLQKNETVEAMQGYLMTSIQHTLEEMHSTIMRRENIENSSIYRFK
ncbi:TPA: replication initiator protein A [Staphylococcus aureus]